MNRVGNRIAVFLFCLLTVTIVPSAWRSDSLLHIFAETC
jgi:hypothetical protein